MKLFRYTILLLFSFIVLASAQQEEPAKSPAASVSQVVGLTNVTITYSSPGVKGRQIWGELVPYGEVWRSGANKATTIEFSTDVKVNGTEVKAGKYSFFTIPGKDEWTVILNSVADQWGAFKYDESKDVLRFNVTPKENPFHERLAYIIDFDTPTKSTVALEWKDLKIPFTVESHVTDPKDENVRPSPTSSVTQTVGFTDITVTYCAPGVKDREIWGGLVPYNEVWRTGANEATTIEFSKDTEFGGNKVPAGKYSLFTIPTEGDWTIILNKTAEQWGAYKYDKAKDLLRFTITPKKSPHMHERMKFVFKNTTDYESTLALVWENLMVPISIKTN